MIAPNYKLMKKTDEMTKAIDKLYDMVIRLESLISSLNIQGFNGGGGASGGAIKEIPLKKRT